MACWRCRLDNWREGAFCFAVFVAAAWDVAVGAQGGPIRYNEPFQIVRPNPDHTGILPVMEGLSKLANVDAKIAVLSVVGPYHSGKSFLLNALVGNPTVFTIGRQTSPETMGIWLCRTEMKAPDGAEVWLMDSEGFFGPGVTDHYDAKIFTVATLLGGHLVYNTVKVIDQQAVHLLEMLARQARLFRTRSSAESSGLDPPDFLSTRTFPNLTWVVEDFVQELPEQHRHDGGATAWLKSYLTRVNQSEKDSSKGSEEYFLSKIYNEIKVHTLFLPATRRDDLQDLSRLEWDQLTPEFKSEVTALREEILSKIGARQFEGYAVSGQTLERAVRFIVQALQRGMFHELPSLWLTWTSQVAEMSLQDADTWFGALLTKIDAEEAPIPIADFNAQVENARERCTYFYKELLRDFEVWPNYRELNKRMEVHFQSKLMLYHERIRGWAYRLIERAKDSIGKYLMSREIPMAPDVLKRSADNEIQASIKDFALTVKAFAASGPRVKLGKAATMPAFSPDPATQLTNDLAALLGARELENEREILKHFKTAVAAADGAVEHELKNNENKLLGQEAMKELRSFVASRCWQTFDQSLAKHRWMMNSPHYRAHKAQVETESLNSRLARFSAANEQKLATHFRQALEKAVNAYRARKNDFQMPVGEPDLEAEHKGVAASIRDILDEQKSTLADTDAYRGAMRQLNGVLEEGIRQLSHKNVELWKVYSDEATRCAVALNHEMERQCSLHCLFNKVPRVHRHKSMEHLIACLAKSSTGARMPKNLQMRVFESWYDMDLARDVTKVWSNFYLMGGSSILIGLLGFCVVCCSPASPAPAGYRPAPPRYSPGAPMGFQ